MNNRLTANDRTRMRQHITAARFPSVESTSQVIKWVVCPVVDLREVEVAEIKNMIRGKAIAEIKAAVTL